MPHPHEGEAETTREEIDAALRVEAKKEICSLYGVELYNTLRRVMEQIVETGTVNLYEGKKAMEVLETVAKDVKMEFALKSGLQLELAKGVKLDG